MSAVSQIVKPGMLKHFVFGVATKNRASRGIVQANKYTYYEKNLPYFCNYNRRVLIKGI